MGIDVDKKINNTVTELLRLVNNITSSSREGRSYGNVRLPAEIIFDQMTSCTESEFVVALKIIKKRFRSFYNRIDIPKQWDGSSRDFYPEAFKDDNKVRCKVNSNDLTANMFFKLPNDEIRAWRFGDNVYVPSDHEKTIECLANKKLLLLN